MRIIAGRFKSRTIKAPAGDTTRPTTDRVREALFSMIQARINLTAAEVLDLYAGSGALGLEALSRGAGSATFVEKNRKVLTALKSNVQNLGVADEVEIVPADVLRFVDSLNASYDLILADPPYALPTMASLPSILRKRLRDGGLLALEHDTSVRFDAEPGVILSRDFGQTRITLFEAVSLDE